MSAGLTQRLAPLMKTGSGSTAPKRTSDLNANNAKELKKLLALTNSTFQSINQLFATSPTSFGSNSSTSYCSAGKQNCKVAWEKFVAGIELPDLPLTPAKLRIILSALLNAAAIFDPYSEAYPVAQSGKEGPLYSSSTDVKIARGGKNGQYTRKYMEPQALDVVNYQGKKTPAGSYIPIVPKSSPFKQIQAIGDGYVQLLPGVGTAGCTLSSA